MTKEAYGIPVPRGVPKDWAAFQTDLKSAGQYFRRYTVAEDWGDPTAHVAWRDRFGRLRLCVAHYSNGRSATVRIDANGVWKTTFGDAAGAQTEAERRLEGL